MADSVLIKISQIQNPGRDVREDVNQDSERAILPSLSKGWPMEGHLWFYKRLAARFPLKDLKGVPARLHSVELRVFLLTMH